MSIFTDYLNLIHLKFANLALLPVLKASWETIYMVFISGFVSIILGLLTGLLLFLTQKNQPLAQKSVHGLLELIINAARSVPYIILMISILPLTRLIMGTTIGINAALVPLTLAAIPFYARICENSFSAIPRGLFETAEALGATLPQLITKLLIPESLPLLIKGMTLTIIGLIGYSAMAGAVGGGGLGELAINYGYERFDLIVTLETVVILIIIVQCVQFFGDRLAKKRRLKPLFWLSLILGFLCIIFQTLPYFRANHQTMPVLRVGVMAGLSEDVMKTAQKEALDKYHFKLKIINFTDYIQPNTALASGNIDANIFQHVPYLETQIKLHGYKLIPIAKTFVYPMGFYSRKIRHLSELKNNNIIALPNDPSNENRALLLLQKSGLINLSKNIKNNQADINNITANFLNLKFVLLDAAQLPRVLKDADLVALTNDYTAAAGFKINQAIIKEGADSPYANVIVIRAADKNNPLFSKLIAVMHSEAVLSETEKLFPDGAAIPAWQKK